MQNKDCNELFDNQFLDKRKNKGEISKDVESLCLLTESGLVNITSLVLCHLEAINVIKIAFQGG